MDTLLEWLWTHLPHREAAFTAIFIGVEVYFVFAPGGRWIHRGP